MTPERGSDRVSVQVHGVPGTMFPTCQEWRDPWRRTHIPEIVQMNRLADGLFDRRDKTYTLPTPRRRLGCQRTPSEALQDTRNRERLAVFVNSAYI